MLSLEEPELEYKENGEHNHHRRTLHALFARNGEVVKKVDENVAEYAKHQAVTNGIGERHHDDGRKCRYTFGDVVDIDVFDILEHEITNINQRWCCGTVRHCNDDWRKEHRCYEERANGDGGVAGAATLVHADGAFYAGGDGGGTHKSASGCSEGVGHKHTGYVWHVAVFIEHVAAGAHANNGTNGVKEIDKEEGEHDDKEVGNGLAVVKNTEVELAGNRGFVKQTV